MLRTSLYSPPGNVETDQSVKLFTNEEWMFVGHMLTSLHKSSEALKGSAGNARHIILADAKYQAWNFIAHFLQTNKDIKVALQTKTIFSDANCHIRWNKHIDAKKIKYWLSTACFEFVIQTTQKQKN